MCVCVCVVFPQPPVVVRFPSFVVESDLWPKMRGKKGVVEEPESESTSSEEEVVDLTEAMKTEFSAFSGASTEPGTTARKPKGKKKKKDKKDKKNVFSLSTFQAEAPKSLLFLHYLSPVVGCFRCGCTLVLQEHEMNEIPLLPRTEKSSLWADASDGDEGMDQWTNLCTYICVCVCVCVCGGLRNCPIRFPAKKMWC